MPKNVYIHIPFCKSKCHYCSFISFDRLDLKKNYLRTLEYEIKNTYQYETLNTLYFGGGTPSNLEVPEFKKLIDQFQTNNKTEITTELNPETLTYEYLKGLYDAGINRISLGVQSFNDRILKRINRRHNSQQAKNAILAAQKVGFNNISADLIYGLPEQDIKMFLENLSILSDLGIQHISLYGLSIDEKCYFSTHPPENLPDEDMQADMYLSAVDYITKRGFEHYEFSNFAKPGYYSRHNLNYWDNNEYYGFGVAAHGYMNNIRYGNIETIEDYLKSPLQKKHTHSQTSKEKLEEEIFLGFRKMSGIDIHKINSKYNIDFLEKYRDIIIKYKDMELIKKTSKGYALTTKGVLVSNTILSEFIDL